MKKNKHWFYRHCGKRFLDFSIALTAVILLSPILGTLSLMVLVFHGKPIFFKPVRPGKDEKIFRLYKFRTMSNAKDKNGNLLPDKDRLTKFGKFLRASSLDEIPEILNILRGDMSIVGPRPLAMKYLPYYTDEERQRHSVRPGLTGLAQVNGRNNLYWDKRIATDLVYVENLSLKMDIDILIKTVQKVIKKEDIVIPDETKNYHFDTYRVVETEKTPHAGEIGGAFAKEPIPEKAGAGVVFPTVTDSTLAFSGRAAMELALKDALQSRKIEKAYVPSYCSLSFLQALIRLEIDYDFYDVRWKDGKPNYRVSKQKDCDLILLMPYFGAGAEELTAIARHYKERGILVIEEITHALLEPSAILPEADYLVLSLRKYLPVPAGGWLGKNGGELAVKPNIDGEEAAAQCLLAMEEKAYYLAGISNDKVPFLEKFSRFESSLVQLDCLTEPDAYSKNYIETVDMGEAVRRRKENAACLDAGLAGIPGLTVLAHCEAPLYFPILLDHEKRNGLAQYLMDQGIYPKVTWPEKVGAPIGIREQELSLIVDQRYGAKDMEKTVELIRGYLAEEK